MIILTDINGDEVYLNPAHLVTLRPMSRYTIVGLKFPGTTVQTVRGDFDVRDQCTSIMFRLQQAHDER